MSYVPTNWQDAPSTATPTSAANLNHMETGIDQAHDLVDRFDQTAMAGAGEPQVLAYFQGNAKWGPKSLFSTDIPGVVTSTITGTTYTLVLADAGKEKETTNAAAVTITVPTNASVAFPTGTIIGFCQYGAGQVTLVGASGVTLNARGGTLKSAGQYAEFQIRKRATDEWIPSGDLVV